MRAHGSVLGLWVRRTLPLTLLVTAATAAVQTGTFLYAMEQDAKAVPVAFWNMELLMDQTRMEVQFVLGLLLVGLAVVRPVLQGGKWRYTLRRLRVREEASILWYAAAAFGCFLLYWGAEAAVCLGLTELAAARSDPGFVSGQTAFLLSQGIPLFQSLLPVTSALAYVRNILMFLTLALFAAMGCRGWRWISVYCVAFLLAARWFAVGIDRIAQDIVTITAAAVCLLAAGAMLAGTWRGGGDEAEDL